jgi:hypothetical protein
MINIKNHYNKKIFDKNPRVNFNLVNDKDIERGNSNIAREYYNI